LNRLSDGEAADACADREWIDAAELAADALYTGVDRGSQYVADEARRALAAIADAGPEAA
jgi:hypothetical protein